MLTPGPDDTSQIASREYAARTIEPGSIVRGASAPHPNGAPLEKQGLEKLVQLMGRKLVRGQVDRPFALSPTGVLQTILHPYLPLGNFAPHKLNELFKGQLRSPNALNFG